MQVEIWTLVMGAVIQALIGTAFWLLIQRAIQKVEKLQEAIEDLKERRVAVIERNLEAHRREDDGRFHAASESRKGMHLRISTIERDYVPGSLCRQQHLELRQGQEEFRAAVVDLAGLRSEINTTTAFLREVNQRVIAAMTDIARLEGRG